MKAMQSGLLPRWALLGVGVLLIGPWLLPHSKLYHQLLIGLFWLPACVALFDAEFRRRLWQPEVVWFLLLAGWTLLVLLLKGDGQPWGQAKVPLYVALSLIGVLLAARDRLGLESVLRVAGLVGGFGALVSVVYFQLFREPVPGLRQIAIGLWDTAIMAAHAVGALVILTLGLCRPQQRGSRLLLGLALVGYALFLICGQTRGVWVALLAALLLVLVLWPNRRVLLATLLLALLGFGLVLLYPEVLLERGLSLRPQVLHGGWQLFSEHWASGYGFHGFRIAVPGTELSFRHPHNLFLDTAIRLGLPGLLLFLGLWGTVLWRAWQHRDSVLGRALLVLWVFASVALQTDGIGLWLKPNADWLITWLPVALSLVLASRQSLPRAASSA